MYSKAKTDAARGSGSGMAELAGASESQTRRLGRWNAGAMEGCYLTALPRDAMRSLADFSPDIRCFFPERAALLLSESLQHELFPFVENYMAAYTKPSAPHLATGGFRNLLAYLRVVILQDAVLLRDLHSAHKLWSHPVFSSGTFVDSARSLKTKMVVEKSPQSVHLQDVVPDLMDCIKQQHEQVLAPIDGKIGGVAASLHELKGDFHPLTLGGATGRLSLNRTDAGSCSSVLQPPTLPTTLPATYKMARSLKTVHQVWQEWTLGIHGGPAVKDLPLMLT
jgi:hypothetical protein